MIITDALLLLPLFGQSINQLEKNNHRKVLSVNENVPSKKKLRKTKISLVRHLHRRYLLKYIVSCQLNLFT